MKDIMFEICDICKGRAVLDGNCPACNGRGFHLWEVPQDKQFENLVFVNNVFAVHLQEETAVQ